MNAQEKILIVDDNLTNIEILGEYLEESYRLDIAASGEEALNKAAEFKPALILLDIMMPGMDGYEVCRRIRATPALSHVKIIMVSAKAMLSERLEGYAAGADDYMTKPFDEEELLAKVRVYLRLKNVEEMDRLKSDLLALLNHETRTPLTGILSPVEMLLADENMDTEQRKLLLTIIHNSARDLQSLFEKILLLSELKSGKARFQMENADLCQVVREAIAAVSGQAQERRIRIETQCPEAIMTPLDSEKIRYVIKAILDNAIRFSPSEGAVQVTAARADNQGLITVTDHGDGIAADFLPRVFDEFASANIDYHAKGHGLSLAISRHIVQGHEGNIEVQSSKETGTTFTVRLLMQTN